MVEKRALDQIGLYAAAVLLVILGSLLGRVTAPKVTQTDNKWSKEINDLRAKDSTLQLKVSAAEHKADSLAEKAKQEAVKSATLTALLAKAEAGRTSARKNVFELNDSALIAKFDEEIKKIKSSR